MSKLATRAFVAAQCRAARGAGFVEWALLAVVAIGVFVLLKDRLADLFGGTADKLTDATDTVSVN